jgi:hypothetical protein
VTRIGWIATGLTAVILLVWIMIEGLRQSFAIITYWTAKQKGPIHKRKRPDEQNSNNHSGTC